MGVTTAATAAAHCSRKIPTMWEVMMKAPGSSAGAKNMVVGALARVVGRPDLFPPEKVRTDKSSGVPVVLFPAPDDTDEDPNRSSGDSEVCEKYSVYNSSAAGV